MANQNQTLPLDLIVSVTVLPTPAVLGEVNINTIALFTNNQPSGWAGGQTYALYQSAAQVGVDFGLNSDAYAIALGVFAQTPNPVATDGYLAIVPLLQTPSVESVRDGVARIGGAFYYYGVLIDNELAAGNPTEFQLLCSDLQTLGHMFAYASSDVNDLNPGSQLDLVRQADEYRCRMLYYGTTGVLLNGAAAQQTQIFSGMYLGRGLSVDFAAVGEAITLNGKELVGIIPDQTIGTTQLALAQAAGIDVYVFIGTPMIFCSPANTWWDQVYNTDAFSQNIQVAGFNYLIPVAFKIPQTDAGVQGLAGAYRAVCGQFVAADVFAPGEWTGAVPPGIPQALFLSNIRSVGYFVYIPPVATQTQAARSQRKSPSAFIAAKFSGALQSANVLVELQQ